MLIMVDIIFILFIIQNEIFLPTAGFEPTISRLLDWRSNRLCYRKSDCRYLKLNGIPINMDTLDVTRWVKASVTKRRGIGPIRTEISPHKIRKKLFIFLIFRLNGIGICQNYFCILSNFRDFGAKTSLFRYLINQKRNNFIKHCSPRVSTSRLYKRCIYI